MDAHARAVANAERAGDDFARLLAGLGSSTRPRGAVWAAYRRAIRALAGNLQNPAVVALVMGQLRAAVADAAREALGESRRLAIERATRDLQAYGLGAVSIAPAQTSDAETAITLALDTQVARVIAARRARLGEAEVLGDTSRVGILSPGAVLAEASRWVVATNSAAYEESVTRQAQATGEEWGKQAVAGLDERTTDCCLRVHGQVVPLDGMFTLTGSPRYADRQTSAPFHWNCRTSIALVRMQDADDKLTRDMKGAARAELRAREETGKRQEIDPANALSRRKG